MSLCSSTRVLEIYYQNIVIPNGRNFRLSAFPYMASCESISIQYCWSAIKYLLLHYCIDETQYMIKREDLSGCHLYMTYFRCGHNSINLLNLYVYYRLISRYRICFPCHCLDGRSYIIRLLLMNDSIAVPRLAASILCVLSFNIKMFISMNKYKDRRRGICSTHKWHDCGSYGARACRCHYLRHEILIQTTDCHNNCFL